MSMMAASSPTAGPTMTRGSVVVKALSKRCNSSGGSLPGLRTGMVSIAIHCYHPILAEDIMNDQAMQDRSLGITVLPPLPVDLYTPSQQATQREAEML